MTTMHLLLGAILLMVNTVLNIFLSRDIINWVPTIRERLVLFILLWLLPVFGFLLVYRKIGPGWFEKEIDEPGQGSSASTGLLALDAIFNPSSAHVLNAQKKSDITIRMEGEMYDRDLPDAINPDDDEFVKSKSDPEEKLP